MIIIIGKIKTSRRGKSRRKGLLIAIITIIIYTIFLMWITGNALHYFPEPAHIGLGQYLDFATGLIYISIFVYGILFVYLINRLRRN